MRKIFLSFRKSSFILIGAFWGLFSLPAFAGPEELGCPEQLSVADLTRLKALPRGTPQETWFQIPGTSQKMMIQIGGEFIEFPEEQRIPLMPSVIDQQPLVPLTCLRGDIEGGVALCHYFESGKIPRGNNILLFAFLSKASQQGYRDWRLSHNLLGKQLGN